ncbi:hypothetical protein N5V64_19255 [Escherichia coli]|uniref:hypothetical protein n=1 Tax=Escherichia coli TaxID=562 RepID=UPI0021B6D138|nr:hypothetical protein [Escherichia coli]MCT7382386.1 hypothetical protein [Escherichia coli]
MPSIFDRLVANPSNAQLVQLAAEIDPDAAATVEAEPAADAAAAADETVVAELTERAEIAEDTAAETELAIEVRGDIEQVDAVVIEIAKDDETAEAMDEAMDELTETVVATESYLKDGGMSAQTAQEHMRNLKRLCGTIGFKLPETMPSFESFGGSASRYDATNMIFLEEQKWWQKLWATIKNFLKTSWETFVKFMDRIFDGATKLKARAAKLKEMIAKRKGAAKNAKVTLGSGISGYIGGDDLVTGATKIADTFEKAMKAADDRADKFVNTVVAKSHTEYADKLNAPAIADVAGPAGWGFKANDGKVTWERSGEAKEVEATVLSLNQLAAAVSGVEVLADKLLALKGNIGKKSQGFKDAVKFGDAMEADLSKKGEVSAQEKQRVQAVLSALKDARSCYVNPQTGLMKYGVQAGNAVLDGAAKMLKEYGGQAAEKPADAAQQ